MENKKRKFNLYNVFHGRNDKKGVEKEDVIKKYDFLSFFKLYGRKFMKLLYVNAFYILGNFPIIFALLAFAKYFDKSAYAPSSPLFATLNGIEMLGISTPQTAVLSGIFGSLTKIYAPTVTTYIFYGIGALTIFTFGLVNVGCTYIIRNLIKCEPVFIWSDFWYAIKTNFRQGFFTGIIDCVIIGVLAYDIYFFWFNYNNGFAFIFFWLSIVMALIYFIMRFYMYVMLITFDLSIFKCIKNSLIFSVLALGRNFLALLGIVALLIITLLLSSVFAALGFLIPLILLFSTASFIGIYAAYPKIKKYMIDPYYDEYGNPLGKNGNSDASDGKEENTL